MSELLGEYNLQNFINSIIRFLSREQSMSLSIALDQYHSNATSQDDFMRVVDDIFTQGSNSHALIQVLMALEHHSAPRDMVCFILKSTLCTFSLPVSRF
jgi:hypothetical protein